LATGAFISSASSVTDITSLCVIVLQRYNKTFQFSKILTYDNSIILCPYKTRYIMKYLIAAILFTTLLACGGEPGFIEPGGTRTEVLTSTTWEVNLVNGSPYDWESFYKWCSTMRRRRKLNLRVKENGIGKAQPR
jgi:hypothetical protein